MKIYNELINKATESIINIAKNKELDNFFSSRNANVLDKEKRMKNSDDFRLITWLIIK